MQMPNLCLQRQLFQEMETETERAKDFQAWKSEELGWNSTSVELKPQGNI